MIQTMSLQNKTEFALIVVVKHTTVNQSGILVVTLRLFAKHAKTNHATNLVKEVKMNKQKVIKAIAMERARKAGKLPPHSCSPDSEIDWMANAIEALEEIASVKNTGTLYTAMCIASKAGQTDVAEEVAKLRALLISIQVPKEVLYAYPVTMQRHFAYYGNNFTHPAGVYKNVELGECEKDDFGCVWQRFTGPKELVEYLRENNIPIKVIE